MGMLELVEFFERTYSERRLKLMHLIYGKINKDAERFSEEEPQADEPIIVERE